MRERPRGIKLTQIPQTILDAIWITRLLGIKYLWVDSLCIIQDDAQDVTCEIDSMGGVYKGAAVTIADSNVAPVFDGFLCLHEPSWPYSSLDFLLEYRDQSNWARASYKAISGVPPEKRGWTF